MNFNDPIQKEPSDPLPVVGDDERVGPQEPPPPPIAAAAAHPIAPRHFEFSDLDLDEVNANLSLFSFHSEPEPDTSLQLIGKSIRQNCASFDAMMDTGSKDYPFLHKIFQTLFAQQEFVDLAFFDPDAQKQQFLQPNPVLYQMIIKQLLFDGYGNIADALKKQMDSVSTISLSPEPALHKMMNIFSYIENRSKHDVTFSHLMNWFLSKNQEIEPNKMAISPPEMKYWEKNQRMPDRVSAAPVGGIREPTVGTIKHDTDSSPGPVSVPLQGAYIGPPQSLQVAYKFGQLGDGPGCLNMPHGFCLGLNNDIVIADTNNHRICIFTLEGQFKFSFGEFGTEIGKLNQPRKIAMMPPDIVDSQNMPPVFVVCDRGTKRSRMQIFSIQGYFVRVIDIPSMDIVSGLTTTQDRKIVVVDSVRSGVLVLNEMGVVLNWFTCAPYMMEPSDIAVHQNKFYICDFKGHCVTVFDGHGHSMKTLSAKMLKFPNGIEVSDHGDIICGDSHGNRFHISVFNNDGQLLGDFDCPFVKVSRCCGLRLSKHGLLVTLAKNNNHVVVMKSITVMTTK